MKPDIHPFTVPWCFTIPVPMNSLRSVRPLRLSVKLSLREMYPYVTLDISSKSHPYYTGKQKTFDNEGSAARFQKRFGHFIGVKRG